MDLKKTVNFVLLLVFSKGVLATPIYEFSYEYFVPILELDYPGTILDDSPPPAIETSIETSAALTMTEFSLFLHATTVSRFFSFEQQQEITFFGSLSNGLFSVDSFEFIQRSGRFSTEVQPDFVFGLNLGGSVNASDVSVGVLPQSTEIISNFQDGSGPLFNFELSVGSTSRVSMLNYGLQEYVFLNGSEFDLTLENIVSVSEPPVYFLIIIAILFIASKKSQEIYNKRRQRASRCYGRYKSWV
jgi:hypothetical protein